MAEPLSTGPESVSHPVDAPLNLAPYLARLVTAQVALHATMAGFRMASPLLALRLGYSPMAVGFLLALFSLTQVFLALPAGRFADRHGLRRPIGLYVCISCSGMFLATAFPVYPVLCFAALCTGGAAGAAIVALQRHAGRLADHPSQLKQIFSWLSLGPSVSNVVGPLAAGLMIDHHGFQSAFALLAIFPLFSWGLVRGATLHEKPLGNAHEPLQASHVAALSPRQSVWALLRQPSFKRLLIINWFLSASWDVHNFVIPLLGHERGISAAVIGSLLGAFALAASTIRFFLPWLTRNVREGAVIGVAMVVTFAVFAVYPLMSNPWLMGVCAVLAGMSIGSVQPMIMSLLHQLTPPAQHGEALGLRLMTLNASSVVMPLLFGSASSLMGVGALFWVSAVVVGLGSALAWEMRVPVSADALNPPGSH